MSRLSRDARIETYVTLRTRVPVRSRLSRDARIETETVHVFFAIHNVASLTGRED